MDNMAIRSARDGDREWAASLMAASEPWLTLRRPYDACLASCWHPLDELHIAEIDGGRCGFVLVRPQGIAGAPYVVSIAVADAFRSRGVGRAMIAFVAKRFATRARHLFLCVSSFNLRAKALYEREGFVQVGELPDFIIEGASERLMCRRLTPADGR
ncbi:MAG: N-acetyltransferase [Acidobacteria bacterium]|nr:N-acetyltransferase [Acidobacteriota bacterium]